MKLLQLLENMINEDVKGVDVRMFALFAEVFDKLYYGLKSGNMDEVYDELADVYTGSKRVSLDYFYNFLNKNKDHFIKEKESNLKEDYKKSLLFNYWDKKGFDSKPIYHYLGLNPKNKEDRAKIFKYILDYYGGYEKLRERFLSEIPMGVPVHIDAGGYSIDYIVTGVDVDIIKPGSWGNNTNDGEIFYEMTGLINGDTSEVTLLTNGETYNLSDLSYKFNHDEIDLDSSTVDEISYEISDVIRDYFDKIGEKYNVMGDMIDYQVVSSQKFNDSIIK